jgi:hypothetical protein
MKFSAIATIATTLALFVAGSTPAFSQTSLGATAPIQVLSLQYQPDLAGTEEEGEGSLAQPGIMVTFKNVTSKPIHAVVLAITDASGHQLGTVSRHGTFSPGVSITRYFGSLKLKDKNGVPANATPVEIGFKDGTQWTAK